MDIGEYLRKQFKESGTQQFHIEGDIWLVPCVVNYSENEYRALLKPLSSNIPLEPNLSKQGWSSVEDEILLKIVTSRGAKAWSAVAKELNTMVHDGKSVRVGRHCRERWYNHVDPNLKKGAWTEEEDKFLLQQYEILGSKWSEISKKIPGRTENSVKNRAKSLMRKKNDGEGLEAKESMNNDEGNSEKEMEIQAVSPNFSTLMLYSPQIMNYDFRDSLLASPQEKFLNPSYLMMRPICNKLPSIQKISDTKEKLKQELIDKSYSPSIFLNFRN